MLNSLTRVLRTTEENGVGAGRGSQGKLIESDDLTTSLDNACTCSFSDTESADSELGDLEETDIVSDGTDNNGGFAFLALHEIYELGEGERGAGNFGHKQSLEDNLVEFAVSAANQEAVELQRNEK